MNFSRRRLLVEQIVVVAVLGCGMKVHAVWHVPHIVVLFKQPGPNKCGVNISSIVETHRPH